MNLSKNDVNRMFICKNGKQGKLMISPNNPSQLVGVIFLEPCGVYWWSRNIEYNSHGKAINESCGFDIKNWLN